MVRKSSKWHMLIVTLAFSVAMGAGASVQASANPNPGVVPNHGQRYGTLGAEWWKWALSFPAADVPYFNTGGSVDLSAHQSGNVWFLAGANGGLTEARTGAVPAGTSLFFPLANYLNDYPCPFPGWEPEPGESLEAFLTRTGEEAVPDLNDLFAEIDGVDLTDLGDYRASSNLFMFSADPALSSWDPCITTGPQPGVTVGYWLLLRPLEPGAHTLHFGAPSWGQDITYEITVTPGS